MKKLLIFLILLSAVSVYAFNGPWSATGRWGSDKWAAGEWGNSLTSLSFYAPLVSTREISIGQGDSDGTFTRASIATVKDYNGNIQNVALGEARFEGARRIHEDRWSSYDSANTAIEFDGADDDVLVADNTAIQNIFDGGGSISCWINPKSDGEADTGRLYDKGGVMKVFISNEVPSPSGAKIRFDQTFSGDNGNWELTARDILINQWLHIVITYDNSATTNNPIFYINGVAKTVGSGLSELQPPTGTRTTDAGSDLYIGNRNGASRTFDGAIDNVQMWDTELSQANVTALYTATSKATSPVSGSVGWWKLDDTGTSVVLDYAGSNNGAFRDNTTPSNCVNVDGVYDTTLLTTLKGVLIEEQRENVIDYSQILDNATGGWTETNITPTLNNALSPDGINSTATKITPDGVGGAEEKSISKAIAGLTNSTVYTFSVFVKKSGFTWVYLDITDKDGTNTTSWFDLDTPTEVTNNNDSSRIETFGSSWYRISCAQSVATGVSNPIFKIGFASADNTSTATGDGTIYNLFWGAQVEAGLMATSYIASENTTPSRIKDVLYYPATNNVNETEGSMVCDFKALGFDASATPRLLTINDNSTVDEIYFELSSATALDYKVCAGSTDYVDITDSTVTANTDESAGAVYKSSYNNLWLDGTASTADTSATIPTGLTHILIGSDLTGGTNQFNGCIKEVKIYKKRLTGDQMIDLTN